MCKKKQPVVNVGIMHGKEICFKLIVPCFVKDIKNNNFQYSLQTSVGDGVVKFVDGAIEWNGKLYKELCFVPYENMEENFNGSFWLMDVTIGVNFHWERKENQKFGGMLKFIVEHDSITAINVVGVEDYLTSVISSEMNANASLELLKAHAVISRSWLLSQIEKKKVISDSSSHYVSCNKTDTELIKWYDREDHDNFDVCADDHCQRYQGLTRASQQKVMDVIKETWGELLMYDSNICDARFSKCCGGVVEEFQNCWENVRHPYLKSVRDNSNQDDYLDLTEEKNAEKWILSNPKSFCNTSNSKILSQVLNNYDQETANFFRWSVEYSQQELSDIIFKRSGIDFGAILDLVPVERGLSGRLIKLKIIGTKRSFIIGKELEIRRILSESHLFSSAFVVEKVGKTNLGGIMLPDKFIIKGAGWGHGVGLCQIGAAVMGENGYTYKQILYHYFPGANVEKRY